jgi:hypothetical protein
MKLHAPGSLRGENMNRRAVLTDAAAFPMLAAHVGFRLQERLVLI